MVLKSARIEMYHENEVEEYLRFKALVSSDSNVTKETKRLWREEIKRREDGLKNIN